MRRLNIMILAAAFVSLCGIAQADVRWTSKGWYQMWLHMAMGEPLNAGISAGPFPTKVACEASLPPSSPNDANESIDYACKFIDHDLDKDNR